MHAFLHHPGPYILVTVAAFFGGAVNAVAGGGTLLTFPSLIAFGLPVLTANGTSTVALVPGSIGAAWGYRRDFAGDKRLMLALALPSLAGGVIGALLALHINDKAYAMVVPWLILGATVLFLLNEPIGRWVRSRNRPAGGVDVGDAGADRETAVAMSHLPGTLVFQLIVAVYGGFFGAGIGILMLAALGFLGLTNIHRMNGLKNAAAVCINLIAALTFVAGGRVNWPLALLMAAAASAGGFGGAKMARAVGQQRVRQLVIAIGFDIAAWMFWKQFG